MPFTDQALLIVAGLLAGIANVIAGGGSLLSVPLLVFLGIPATVANATSRPAIIAQNLVALWNFRRAGLYEDRVFRSSVILLTLCTLPGAALGAWFAATKISDTTFERILAVLLLVIAVATWFRRRRQDESAALSERRPLFLLVAFIGIGFYGGFVQAGVGFIFMAVLLHGSSWTMTHINAAKVAIVLVYSLVALAVFGGQGQINWPAASWLIVGQSVGGFVGSQVSMRARPRTLMAIYVFLLVLFALKLLI
ncbi:MAG: sulfite exporter TauE/SafE family protein [Planctomycetes bacterium]|nr:sulfite exporter TauE/SafE family protein [Planctomycetota bacterium]